MRQRDDPFRLLHAVVDHLNFVPSFNLARAKPFVGSIPLSFLSHENMEIVSLIRVSEVQFLSSNFHAAIPIF